MSKEPFFSIIIQKLVEFTEVYLLEFRANIYCQNRVFNAPHTYRFLEKMFFSSKISKKMIEPFMLFALLPDCLGLSEWGMNMGYHQLFTRGGTQ